MKRIGFVIIFVLCFHVSVRAQPVDSLFVQVAYQKMQHAKEYSLKVAQLMPAEDYGFKPAPDEMSFGKQLLHLSENLCWLSSSYLKQDQNPISKNDLNLTQKDSIILIVHRAYDYALLTLETFNPSELSKVESFFAGPMNKIQIINLINDHQTHHRAQLLVYLRMKGIKPPAYVGW